MKNAFYKILVGCLVAWTLGSCLPDPLDVKNIPVLTPHIVIASQVVPDQTLAVLVTHTIGALDAGSASNADTLLNDVVINDALVTVAYQDKLDTLQFLGVGVYGSTTTALIDEQVYTLTVSSPVYGTVTSVTAMKQAVKFDSVSVNLFESGKDTLLNIRYGFTDPPGKNWYMLDVQRIRTVQRLTDNLNPRVFVKLLTDDDFSGQSHAEEFSIPFRRFSPGDTVAVSLANISEAYYGYLKKRAEDRNNISDFVSDPLHLPSNVTGGYGYFNMQVPDIHIFRLK